MQYTNFYRDTCNCYTISYFLTNHIEDTEALKRLMTSSFDFEEITLTLNLRSKLNNLKINSFSYDTSLAMSSSTRSSISKVFPILRKPCSNTLPQYFCGFNWNHRILMTLFQSP